MSQRIEVELDDSGRLVLPAPIGRQLGLAPGMTLVVEQEASDVAYLRIQGEQPRLVDKQGVLVVEAESIEEVVEPVQQEREQRLMDLLQRVSP